MRQTRLYLAGPMRGIPKFNFPAFHAAAAALRARGYRVFSPAEFDDIFGEKELDITGYVMTHPIHSYIRRDVHVIINELEPNTADGIVMLPGWSESLGASAEVHLAAWCELKQYKLEDLVHGIADRP